MARRPRTAELGKLGTELRKLNAAEQRAVDTIGPRPTVRHLLFLAWVEAHGGHFADSPAKRALIEAIDRAISNLEHVADHDEGGF